MAHTASLSQLQTPPWALVDGELVPYEDVRIHVSAEALTRALSVFEGLKGYWNADSSTFAVRSPRRHYDRLGRSAALLHIPVHFTYEEFVSGLAKLAGAMLSTERDMWFRSTLYGVEGHWGEGTRAQLITTAFSQSKAEAEPMKLGVSTWRRSTDTAFPTRVKTGAMQVVGRLARIEARRLGYDDAILLDAADRVAEATGAAVLIANEQTISSPPASEGCLDSITVLALQGICQELDMPFERRPIERTELLTAAECGLAGTISELTLVDCVDGFSFSRNGVLAQVRRRYLDVMRRVESVRGVDLVELDVM